MLGGSKNREKQRTVIAIVTHREHSTLALCIRDRSLNISGTHLKRGKGEDRLRKSDGSEIDDSLLNIQSSAEAHVLKEATGSRRYDQREGLDENARPTLLAR